MKLCNPEDWLRQRIERSEQSQEVPVDVADRVLATLASYDSGGVVVDKTPIVLGGSLLALAASIVLVFFPSLATMTEPWISFWLI